MARVPKQKPEADRGQAPGHEQGTDGPVRVLAEFISDAERSADDAGVSDRDVQEARQALRNLEIMLERAGSAAPRQGHASGVRQITVVWGEETHQPIQYNGFRIGGLQVVADVHLGETVEDAYERLFSLLDQLGRKQFEKKLDGFLERAKAGAAATRKAPGRT